MAISNDILNVLESIVGPEYVSADPVICESYRSGPGGYENGTGYERVMTTIPGAVIMPRTTEEVQKIVKVCYRNNVPYVPYATGFYGPRSHPHVEDALLIDMKRMQDFFIDEKHFLIDVQPGVIYSPIQQECLDHGAYVVIGGGGAQASAI
ncbi:MAG: FAD-binding oxidoreductase, partial [Deltaproteobacteria bacterium]|nr:FAD-binding oxidoreductase [Deltaproteobacteria bacterium]